MKYAGKEHNLHLKTALDYKYKGTTDCNGKLYVIILLTWDYDKGVFQLVISGYVCALIHSFQHEKTKGGQDSSYLWNRPQYGNNNKVLNYKHPEDELDASNQKCLQNIIRKFLYYARSIDSTMLMELKYLVTVHTKPTVETGKKSTHFLNYCASHPDAVKEYRRIDMIMHLYTEYAYPPKPESRIRS